MAIVYDSSYGILTWAEMQTLVRNALWRSESALPDADVDRGIHAALQELENEQDWLWLEGINSSFSTDSEDSEHALPDSISHVEYVAHKPDANQYDLLERIPLVEARALANGTSASDPNYYAISNGQIYFDTLVAASTAFELIYTAGTPPFLERAIATPPDWMTRVQFAIVPLAASNIALGYLKDEGEATRQRTLYAAHLNTLQNQEATERSRTGGQLEIQPFTEMSERARGYVRG